MWLVLYSAKMLRGKISVLSTSYYTLSRKDVTIVNLEHCLLYYRAVIIPLIFLDFALPFSFLLFFLYIFAIFNAF